MDFPVSLEGTKHEYDLLLGRLQSLTGQRDFIMSPEEIEGYMRRLGELHATLFAYQIGEALREMNNPLMANAFLRQILERYELQDTPLAIGRSTRRA